MFIIIHAAVQIYTWSETDKTKCFELWIKTSKHQMDPGFMQGLHKSMAFISILFASHLHRYCAFCTCGGAFWCQYVCMLWWATIREGIIVFLLGWVATRGHSQPPTQQINAQIPLWKLCCIFVCEIFTKIPLIARQVQTVLWRKSKFVRWGNPFYSLEKIQICELGKSFWLGGCPDAE